MPKKSIYVDSLSEDAKETYKDGIFIDLKGIVYITDLENRKFKKFIPLFIRNPEKKNPKKPYLVNANKTTYYLHRLYFEAFVENPYKDSYNPIDYYAIPLDGDYTNLVPENFKWMLRMEYNYEVQLPKRYKKCRHCGKKWTKAEDGLCAGCRSELNRKQKGNTSRIKIKSDRVDFIRKNVTSISEEDEKRLEFYAQDKSYREMSEYFGDTLQNDKYHIDKLYEEAVKNSEEVLIEELKKEETPVGQRYHLHKLIRKPNSTKALYIPR